MGDPWTLADIQRTYAEVKRLRRIIGKVKYLTEFCSKQTPPIPIDSVKLFRILEDAPLIESEDDFESRQHISYNGD